MKMVQWVGIYYIVLHVLTVAIVTEKEWQEISTDDDDEPVVATSNKTKTISSVKAKPKQSTLGAFFHKK